jgi:hypothetical protein
LSLEALFGIQESKYIDKLRFQARDKIQAAKDGKAERLDDVFISE